MDPMKWLIASDIHGSAYWCERLLTAYDKEGADRLLLLGDILYHGPRNDLPQGYAPKQVISMLNARANDILCVGGNCDAYVDQMVLSFPVLADYALLPVGKRLIFATHGHIHHKNALPPLKEGDILLHGHTHVPVIEPLKEGITYLNPGSVSLPKENSPHSYIIWEDDLMQWKDMDGNVYQEYRLL